MSPGFGSSEETGAELRVAGDYKNLAPTKGGEETSLETYSSVFPFALLCLSLCLSFFFILAANISLDRRAR